MVMFIGGLNLVGVVLVLLDFMPHFLGSKLKLKKDLCNG